MSGFTDYLQEKEKEQLAEVTLTKKHFTAIANVLKVSKDKKEIVMRMAEFLSGLNPKFDKERFMKATM